MPPDLSTLDWPVRTDRLSLRPATLADLEPTGRIRRQPGVSHWLTVDAADEEEYAARFASPARLAKTLVVERDGEVIGDLMIGIESPWAQAEVADRATDTQAELGWVLAPGHAGQGLATEAVRAMIDLCFRELGLRRVVAHCFADNTASWRLMERLGMRRESHTVQESLHRSGAWLDGYSYAILAEEWPA